MILLTCILGAFVIFAGTKLLIQCKQEALGRFYKFIAWFLLAIGFSTLLVSGGMTIRFCCSSAKQCHHDNEVTMSCMHGDCCRHENCNHMQNMHNLHQTEIRHSLQKGKEQCCRPDSLEEFEGTTLKKNCEK